jgi:hypothetical protein
MKASKRTWIFAVLLIVFNAVFFWLKPGGEFILTIVSDGLPIISVFVALLGVGSAVKSFSGMDQTKGAWLLLFIGMILFFCAECTYGALEVIFKVDVNTVFPTIADLFWTVAYAPIFVGLILLVTGYRKSGLSFGRPWVYALGLVVFLFAIMVISKRLFTPIMNDPETGRLAKCIYLYYPVADLFVIIPAMVLSYITYLFGKSLISRPWRYIALGFLCMTTFDIVYSYLSWNDMYSPGNYLDLLQNLSYLLIGLGGFYQKELLESI